MDTSERLDVAEAHISFLRRRINELERQVESLEAERSQWMNAALKFKNSIRDHRRSILQDGAVLKSSTITTNVRLWSIL